MEFIQGGRGMSPDRIDPDSKGQSFHQPRCQDSSSFLNIAFINGYWSTHSTLLQQILNSSNYLQQSEACAWMNLRMRNDVNSSQFCLT